MATEKSNHDGDSQEDKPAKKKTIPSDRASADDSDVSTRLPERVHLFPGKSRPKSEPLQCSSFEQVVNVVEAQAPVISFGTKLARFKVQMEKGKKAMYEAAMRVEDLDAMIKGVRQARELSAQRRYLRELQLAEGRGKSRILRAVV